MIAPYLIKSILCLLFLVAFYKIALENTPLHMFKRFFLLSSLVFSFTIPLITITYTSDDVILAKEIQANTIYEIPSSGLTDTQKNPEEPLFPLEHMLWSIYGLGVLCFGIRFVRNLYQIRQKITTGYTVKEHHYALSLLSKAIVPHSFLSWIFLSRKSYEENAIPPEVIAHEAAHVRQLHSLDILFVELLTVFFWFNPMVWIATSSVKLNHEFLADQEALKTASNSHTYQQLLLCHASGPHQAGLESPLNYSSLKKRIIMLSKTPSTKKITLRMIGLIPILVLCIYFFSQNIVAKPIYDTTSHRVLPNNNEVNAPSLPDTKKMKSLSIQVNGMEIKINDTPVLLKDFVSSIDQITNTWSAQDFEFYNFSIQFESGDDLRELLNSAYKKTELYKINQIELAPKQTAFSYSDEIIKLKVEGRTIFLNGDQVEFKDFVKAINKITKKWSNEDLKNFSFHINAKNADRSFLNRLEAEFEKTQLYKKSGRSMLPPPPPPAPAPPNALKGTAYPPPPPPRNATVYRSDQMVSGDIQINGKSYTVNENEDGEVSYYDENGKKLTGKEEKLVRGKIEALSAKRIQLLRKSDSIRLQGQKIRKEADRIRAEADKIRVQSERVRAQSKKVRKEAEATREELMEQREEAREEAEAQREELKERKEVIMAQREARRTQMMSQGEQQTATMTKRRQIIRERDDGVSFPLPPVPPEPLDLIVSMAKQNAVFFYNDKPITSDKAIDLIKNNESLNIHVKEFAKSNPVVNLSTKAFNLED